MVNYVIYSYLKSDQAVLLLNLCVALFVSYIIFLAGVDRTESKVGCLENGLNKLLLNDTCMPFS